MSSEVAKRQQDDSEDESNNDIIIINNNNINNNNHNSQSGLLNARYCPRQYLHTFNLTIVLWGRCHFPDEEMRFYTWPASQRESWGGRVRSPHTARVEFLTPKPSFINQLQTPLYRGILHISALPRTYSSAMRDNSGEHRSSDVNETNSSFLYSCHFPLIKINWCLLIFMVPSKHIF